MKYFFLPFVIKLLCTFYKIIILLFVNFECNIKRYNICSPANNREKCIRSMDVVEVAPPKDVVIKQPLDTKTKKFTFDRTFGQNSTQVYYFE